MSGHDDVAAATDGVQLPAEESLISRRSALWTAAGAGLAATALAATAGPALAATRPAGAGARHAGQRDTGGEHADSHEAVTEPIVAHLRNARTGEIDVFRGEAQTRLHDHALAALLIKASK